MIRRYWKELTLVAALCVVVVGMWPLMSRADGPTKPLAPIVIGAAERQAIIISYQAVESANKDLTIAILKARLACKVGEDWNINLQTMTFEPPAAPKVPQEKPKP